MNDLPRMKLSLWHRLPASVFTGRMPAPQRVILVGALLTGMITANGCNAPSKNRSGNQSSARPSEPRALARAKASRRLKPAARELIVNGEVVTVEEILKPIRADLMERSGRLPRADYRRYVTQVVFQRTRDRIVDIVLYQKASLRLTPAEEEALDAMVATEMRKRITEAGNGTQHEYQRFLASRHTTLEEERQRHRRQLIVQRYFQLNLQPKVQEPTRAQLLAVFEADKAAMTRPERRRMSLIEVRLMNHLEEGVTTPSRDQQRAARAAARKIIEQAYEEIRGGRDFAGAARQFSEGINATGGGSWGWVGRDSLRARWQAAAERLYTLDEGQVSEVLDTDEGSFLVRCDEIQQAVKPDFEVMQPQLISAYRNDAYAQLINELIESLIEEARIEPPDIEPFILSVVEGAPPVQITNSE